MSQKHQVKLLRVLQEKKLRRVGDSKERSVDFRIVAATNEMKRALADGRFRPDLYMRLDVLRIEVPPLRERASDIALLAEQSLGDSGREFARDALDLMERFAWPGNVRQLENVVTRVLAYCDSNPIPASEVEPLLRDSLIYFSDDPKGMACRCRDAVAQLVADELAKGNDPSQGLRQGSAQLGQLAQTVAEGIVEGLRLYLATDEGVRQHGAASNEDLMVLIGASGRSGNPSLLMRELVQRVRTIVDEMTAQRSAD
jgi:DNA-binding NtrC family response regulator